MKVVGLCKALTCGDFIPAVLSGIYYMLDAIVFVYPQRDWNGNLIANEVKGQVANWVEAHDHTNKVDQIYTAAHDQNEQYQIGIDYVARKYQPDWIFIFDSDEVWEHTMLAALLDFTAQLTIENAVKCGMHTYIRSPLYRIDPPEPCHPCVMVRPLPAVFRGVRGNKARPAAIAEEVNFHHYSYVRRTLTEVLGKARLSTGSDGAELVNLDKWKKEKWFALPHARDLHTTVGAESYWKSVKVLSENEVPVAVRELPIYNLTKGGSV